MKPWTNQTQPGNAPSNTNGTHQNEKTRRQLG
jgi:hypothetical protein